MVDAQGVCRAGDQSLAFTIGLDAVSGSQKPELTDELVTGWMFGVRSGSHSLSA